VSAPPPVNPGLAAAVASPARLPAAVARDSVRHPVEELTFFGLAPTQTVIELWPGGGYWTDILGPYLAPHGHYYVALPVQGDAEEDTPGVARWRARFTAQPEHYGRSPTTLGLGWAVKRAPPSCHPRGCPLQRRPCTGNGHVVMSMGREVRTQYIRPVAATGPQLDHRLSRCKAKEREFLDRVPHGIPGGPQPAALRGSRPLRRVPG